MRGRTIGKRLAACLLSVALAAGMLAGCGGKGSTEAGIGESKDGTDAGTDEQGTAMGRYVEKDVELKGPLRRARLYISGLGLYEAFYQVKEDGFCAPKRIGEEYLTPYSNDYNEWVQYQTYDVTDLLQGSGRLSVLLGNGWYKARFGFSALEDVGFYGNEWKLIAELQGRSFA